LRNPPLRMLTVQSAASHRRGDALHRIQRRHIPIGSKGERYLRIEQRSKSVSAARTLRTDSLLRPAAVVCAMIGLHGRNYVGTRKSQDIAQPQMLSMFDAEPTIARRRVTADRLVNRQDL